MYKFSWILLFIWTSVIFIVETKPCSDKCQHSHLAKVLRNIQQENLSHGHETDKTINGDYNAHHTNIRGKRGVPKHVSAPELNSTNRIISNKTKKSKVAKKQGKPVKLNKETQIKKKTSKKNISEVDIVAKKNINNEVAQNKTDEKKTSEKTSSKDKIALAVKSMTDSVSSTITSPNSNETTHVSASPILPSTITKLSEHNVSDDNKTVSQNEIKNLAESDKNKSKDEVSNKNENNIKSFSVVELKNSTYRADQENKKNKIESKLLGKSSRKNALNGNDKKQKLSESKGKKKVDDNSIDKSDSKNSKLINPPKKYKTIPTKGSAKNSTLRTSKQKKKKLEKTIAVLKQRHVKTKTAVTMPAKTDKATIKIKKNLVASNRTLVKRSQHNERKPKIF